MINKFNENILTEQPVIEWLNKLAALRDLLLLKLMSREINV